MELLPHPNNVFTREVIKLPHVQLMDEIAYALWEACAWFAFHHYNRRC